MWEESGIVATVNLDKDVIDGEIVKDVTDLEPRAAVVGQHSAVLGEHEVDGPACLPPLEIHGYRIVQLLEPLGFLL